jgi:hypothetical protein
LLYDAYTHPLGTHHHEHSALNPHHNPPWHPALQLSADDKFGSYMELTLQLASTQGLIPAMRSSGARSALAPVKAQLQLWLLDEDVGAVLGKRGQTLTQIQQVGWRGMQGQGKLCVCVGGGGGLNNGV